MIITYVAMPEHDATANGYALAADAVERSAEKKVEPLRGCRQWGTPPGGGTLRPTAYV